MFSSFDIEPPETKGAEMVEDPRGEWERHLEAFMFIVCYPGLTLIAEIKERIVLTGSLCSLCTFSSPRG